MEPRWIQESPNVDFSVSHTSLKQEQRYKIITCLLSDGGKNGDGRRIDSIIWDNDLDY